MSEKDKSLLEQDAESNTGISVLIDMVIKKGLMEVILSDNTILFGYPDCLVPEEDDEEDEDSLEHDELVFRIYKEGYGVFLREEEVKSFRKVDKDYVEAILAASQESAE